jgi:hypothetical protein
MAAPAVALSHFWTHLIAGHPGRLGTRDDVTVHQQYIADIEAGAKTALATVDPTPYFQKYGENLWATVKGFLDAVADVAAAPVIEKYTGVLGAVDVFTVPTAFTILASIRLDLGYRMDVHSRASHDYRTGSAGMDESRSSPAARARSEPPSPEHCTALVTVPSSSTVTRTSPATWDPRRPPGPPPPRCSSATGAATYSSTAPQRSTR